MGEQLWQDGGYQKTCNTNAAHLHRIGRIWDTESTQPECSLYPHHAANFTCVKEVRNTQTLLSLLFFALQWAFKGVNLIFSQHSANNPHSKNSVHKAIAPKPLRQR